ncbi:MAG: PilW family protein [Gammaproteobacteria bacterium]
MLIAGALGTFVLAGMIQVLTSTKQTYQIESALTEIQESGRYALHIVGDALRYRGFQGCLLPASLQNQNEENLNWNSLTYTVPIANNYPSDNISRTNLRGFSVGNDDAWSPNPSLLGSNSDIEDLRNGISGYTPRSGSDVISVQYASPVLLTLASKMSSRSAPIVTNDTNFSVSKDDILYIGDCSVGDVFRVSNDPATTAPITIEHATSHNTTANFRRAYETDAKIRVFRTETFFVADTGRNNQFGEDTYGLFRMASNGTIDEIAEGVEFLRILYGEELSDGNIRFLPATDVNLNMRRVVSIQIGLLIKSLDPVTTTTDSHDYTLPGVDIGPNGASQHSGGNYLRREFNTTIQMRNKG